MGISSLNLLRIFAAVLLSVPISAWAMDNQEGIVETRILDFDPQAGVKSQHFYFIDFVKQTVTDSSVTGSTTIEIGDFSFDVASIRDNFGVSDVAFAGDVVTFVMAGSTASGTMVTPDIDYRLNFRVTRDGDVSVGGCHDAYPAYLVQHDGKDIYRFEHKSLDLLSLFGTCDTPVLAP